MNIAPLIRKILAVQSNRVMRHAESQPPSDPWHDLTWESLPNWISQMTAGDSPMILQVEGAGAGLVNQVPNPTNIDFHHYPASDTLDIRLYKRENDDLHQSFQTILSLAAAIDPQRRMVFSSQGTTDTIGADVATTIDGWPMVGPGGRLTFYDCQDHIDVDLVVRKRIKSIRSQWRSSGEIVEDLRVKASRQATLGESSTICGALGYFELSKFEAQNWVRPVFLFYVTRSADVEATPLEGTATRNIPVTRLSTVAVAATSSAAIPLEAGLGSWS
jgi:hypothetical protein